MKVERFSLTEDHIKLARRMYVGWQDCETGAPEIDPKRPYGNSSVEMDVAEILGRELSVDGEEGELFLTDTVREECAEIHRSMEQALQIILQVGSFQPGQYTREWLGKWVAE